MTTESVENSNSENKNLSKLDEELEAEIEKANNVMRNLGESILNVYNLARDKGYDPFSARRIVEERIINVTPQYIRRMLPDEAKHIEKRRDLRNSSFSKSVTNNNNNIQIPPRQEIIQEAEPARFDPADTYIDKSQKPEHIQPLQIPPSQEENDIFEFKPNQHTKMVLDLTRIKQSVKYTGFYIKRNGEVGLL